MKELTKVESGKAIVTEAGAKKSKEEILKLAEFKNIHIGVIGPIVGASVGPGTVIGFCFGTEVTIEGNE